MKSVELERTFLVKSLPDIGNCESKVIVDVYLPKTSPHPVLRIRKNGSKYEITKKSPVTNDASIQNEHTIILGQICHPRFLSC